MALKGIPSNLVRIDEHIPLEHALVLHCVLRSFVAIHLCITLPVTNLTCISTYFLTTTAAVYVFQRDNSLTTGHPYGSDINLDNVV